MGYGEKHGKGFRGRYLRPDGISYGTLPEKFRTKVAAKKAADAEELKIRSGSWIDPAGPATLVRDWWKRYRPSLDRAPNTLESYDQSWVHHIEPRWGHLPLGEVFAVDLDTWKLDLRAVGLKESSIGVIVAPLHGLLNAAARNRLIVGTPVAPRQARSRSEILADAQKREGISVDPAVVDELCARARLPRDRMLIRAGYSFGYRWSETIAVRRPDLSLTRGGPGTYRMDKLTGAVHDDRSGRRFLGPPKSGGGRLTDIWPALGDELLDYIELLPEDQEYLFVQVRARGWLSHTEWMRTVWRPLCDGDGGRPGVFPGLNFHDLKHSHKALMNDLGIHTVLQDDRLGHKKGDVSDEYNRPTAAMRSTFLDTFQRWSLEKISQNSPIPVKSLPGRSHLRLASVDGHVIDAGERFVLAGQDHGGLAYHA